MRRALLSLVIPFALLAACGGAETSSQSSSGAGGSGGVITGAGGGATAGSSSSGSPTSASASSSSSGDAGPSCPDKPLYPGAPMSMSEGQWTWIPFPEAKCRDGSPTGIGVRKGTVNKLMIYFEGGGACFNGTTCAINLGTFGQSAFDAWKGSAGNIGIFNAGNASNPVKDWSAVYVPFCTGDVHAGARDNVDVPGGPSNQSFVGFTNVGHYLDRIVPTFQGVSQVLVTGISAGGFGAAFNYDRIATAFCPADVVLLDDSGPPMADGYLAPCLQKQWRDLWGLDQTLPADCADCTQPDGGGIVHYAPYLAAKWPQYRLGLISSTHDSVISTFYGFGSNNCTSSAPLSGQQYEMGLMDLRTMVSSYPGWGSYYVDSITHTYLLAGIYTTTVDNTSLTSWIKKLLNGQASHVGP